MDSPSPSEPANPYSSPRSEERRSEEGADLPSCPSCGEPMESGELHSNGEVYWRSAEMSALRKLVRGGEKLAVTRSGLGCSYAAHRCRGCRLVRLA